MEIIISNKKYSLYIYIFFQYLPQIFKIKLIDKLFSNKKYCLTINGENRKGYFKYQIFKSRLCNNSFFK
jgi:hypothetical protein